MQSLQKPQHVQKEYRKFLSPFRKRSPHSQLHIVIYISFPHPLPLLRRTHCSCPFHSYNTRSSTSRNFYIQKSNREIQKKTFSRIGAKLWNEIPTKLRNLPKRTFSKRIRDLLLLLLESEDSYVDLETMISKLKMHDG